MTREYAYCLMAHATSGEVFAIRYLADDNTVTGICGPLASDERDGMGSDYDYNQDETEEEARNWFEAENWRWVRDLP